ncbi:MAG: DNA-binding response regulator [Elusimicrobia bacterium RIFOXYA2_FULL_58_8]|nr:MAG: DNA-binding response regulator [Elusimicrobia bacterium RIFOXYA12_FULL_57_11]OGS16571.1 MAG: DNA-binding response regulator [Elusimicrobia bacterium RIFOXYA2_FULL_58_8]
MDTKILIVEDEKDIARMLDYNLRKEGYKTLLLHDGSFAAATAAKERPALILLDLMLPGLDGLDVCRRLKLDAKTAAIPVIMLTAKGEESDKVLGLGLGADDYITKPFGIKELLARVSAVLRRSRAAAPAPDICRAGELELDPARVAVTLKGKPLSLTAREFELLKALMASGGKMLSREALLEKAWGLDASVEIETRTVDVHIGTLRKKLGAEGKRIVTVKNYGYRFEAE